LASSAAAVSAGGAFDPDAWAQLFADAGAKFAGPVAEHHDGFSMWNIANHTAFNFTGYYQWVPPQSDPSLQKLYGQLPATRYYKGITE
jgi:alpha-L-fucosidase